MSFPKGARAGKKVAEAIERRAKAANRIKNKAKEAEKKDKAIAGGVGLGVGTTTVVGGSLYAGGKRERERLKKEEERIKKFREKNSKPKNKTPVKKARGGMVTRWESKWG